MSTRSPFITIDREREALTRSVIQLCHDQKPALFSRWNVTRKRLGLSMNEYVELRLDKLAEKARVTIALALGPDLSVPPPAPGVPTWP